MSWASEELEFADLGDKRRNQRLVKIVEDLAAAPNASIPQAVRDNAALQGLYDFWRNPRVEAKEILAAHTAKTIERVTEHSLVLAVQDTTEWDFTAHRSKQGMGSLSNPSAKGLKGHSVLCVSPEGVPLGLLHQQVWARVSLRRGKGYRERKRAIEDKESGRWLSSLEQTQQLIPGEVGVVTIADREADIYDLFALPRREGSEFLIRANHDRSVKLKDGEEVESLFNSVTEAPICGQLTLELQRTPKRKARSATLTVRVATVFLQPPKHRRKSENCLPIKVQAILAVEENPPIGEKAVCWLLLTTLSVSNWEQACQCLLWYSYRWLIERFHYVLKSGCHLEELQLETADRIQRAIATYGIVAWRLLWLTYSARVNPDKEAEGILSTHEWQALYCTIHKTPIPPDSSPTLSECVRWIAQLGGFLGRKSDGEPGVKTLWRGIQRLNDLAAMWQMLAKNFRPE